MPGGDRTGPEGLGPLTGWGRGDCGSGVGFGAGGRGFGRGRGWRNRGRGRWMYDDVVYGAAVPSVPQDEASLLKVQAEQLKEQLAALQARINDLES